MVVCVLTTFFIIYQISTVILVLVNFSCYKIPLLFWSIHRRLPLSWLHHVSSSDFLTYEKWKMVLRQQTENNSILIFNSCACNMQRCPYSQIYGTHSINCLVNKRYTYCIRTTTIIITTTKLKIVGRRLKTYWNKMSLQRQIFCLSIIRLISYFCSLMINCKSIFCMLINTWIYRVIILNLV